jgi:hypothetical protein
MSVPIAASKVRFIIPAVGVEGLIKITVDSTNLIIAEDEVL